MVVMDMVVTDTVDTVERDQLSHTTAMVVMDMVVTDTVDTVERDQLSHTMAMVDTVDTDTHTLMEVTTILERDLPNHLLTTVMDTVVVMDMVVTDTAVTATDMAVKPCKKLIASII